MRSASAQFSFSAISLLHITTLFTLAVAHPLYDLLGHADHLPFFIARQSRAIDIWLLVLSLSLLLPSTLYIALYLLSLVSQQIARACYSLVLAILFFALFLQIPGRFIQSESLIVVFSFAAAATVTFLYRATHWTRTFMTFMSIAIVLSPILFLSSASMESFLSSSEAHDYTFFPNDARRPTVVMIIFDELPLISLLDQDRQIDKVRFPNFHRLSQTATWYRNATTIHYSTSPAIASLLLGSELKNYLTRRDPSVRREAATLDRKTLPNNLFSLLSKDYQLFAVELITKLAPETMEATKYIPPLRERMTELAVDLSVLYAHLVTPPRVRQHLPSIEGQWRGFLRSTVHSSSSPSWPYADSYKRLERIRQFIDLLQKRNSPSFYFLHSLLPHYPFVFNERGQQHANKFAFMTMHLRRATGSNEWPDETTANLAYQAHLLQLGFTDVLLGRILDRLTEVGLFDECLLIVASDHGTSFYWDAPGLPTPNLVEVQASGTMYVPLMIKLPGQTGATISHVPVQTIDVVPTVADILNQAVPWDVDGVSVIEETRREPGVFAYLPEYMRFSPGPKLDSALERKIELFGAQSWDAVYRMGPRPEMVNRAVRSFPSRTATGTIKWIGPERYVAVDPSGPRVPAYVEGTIGDLPSQMRTSGLIVAVAVNGVIRATTRTTAEAISKLRANAHGFAREQTPTVVAEDGAVHFLVRVPPESFAEGRNRISIHGVVEDGDDGATTLLDFARE